MIKSVQSQIQNEYATQINDLEENLKSVGEFEAEISKNSGGKAIMMLINFVFSYIALIIAIIAFVFVQFFLDDLIKILSVYIEFSDSFYTENSEVGIIMPKDILSIFLYTVSLLLLLTSSLLKSIRNKNGLIIRIELITADLKDQV